MTLAERRGEAGQGVIEKEQTPHASSSVTRLLWLLLPASGALYAVYNGLQQISLPAQVQAVDAAHKIDNIAILTSVTSLTAVAGLLAGGALSDRTTGRWGRRTPWLFVMALLSAMLIVALGLSTSFSAILIWCSVLWFTANFYQAVLTAVLPDRIPDSARAKASAIIGVGSPIGIFLGLSFVARVSPLMGNIGLAVALVVSMVLFVTFAPEGPAPARMKDERPQSSSWMNEIGKFFSGFRSADFCLAFFSRALMFLGLFAVLGFAYYILQDVIGVAQLPNHDAGIAVSILASALTLAWLVAGPIAGWIADRFKCTKRVVGFASIGMVIATLMPVLMPNWTGMLAFYILAGVFFGSYMSVDLALMSFVLPNKNDEGRDMAILAVATSSPQLVAPLLASVIVKAMGYSPLFIFAAIVSLLGGLMVFAIKKVR